MFNFRSFQIGYIVAGVSLVAPLVCSIFVSHFSRKRALLVSTSLMSATLIFLALIIHFQADNKQVRRSKPAGGWDDVPNNLFLNGPNSASFSFIFSLSNQILQCYIKCGKYPSNIRRRDSNSQPSDCVSPPLTTRPGFPPCLIIFI